VLPRTYRITRYPPGHDQEYLPAAMVYAVLDATNVANNRYRFVVTVEPDIPPFTLRGLRASLAVHAPAASLVINLPTEVATRTELPSMPLAIALAPPRFTVTGKGVQIVLDCQIADALVLRSAIERAGAVLGRLAFTFEDASQLESDIEIAIGRITGPWGAGPVSVERNGGRLRLFNHIDQALEVSGIRLYHSTATSTEFAIGEHLEAGESIDISVVNDDAEAAVVYALGSDGPNTLEESRVFIENVSTNVIFTCGINYEARNILDIELYARLSSDGLEKRVILSNVLPRVGSAEFTVPLSSVVGPAAYSPVIEYRLMRTMIGGERIEKPWSPCLGAVVDIQWGDLAT